MKNIFFDVNGLKERGRRWRGENLLVHLKLYFIVSHSLFNHSIFLALFNVTVSYFWLSYGCGELWGVGNIAISDGNEMFKAQKHKTNIVKYSCRCEENSSLNIRRRNYFAAARDVSGWLRDGMKFTVRCWNTSFIHFCHKLYYVVVRKSQSCIFWFSFHGSLLGFSCRCISL